MIVTFWINAFIPRTVPNYTIFMPNGDHANKTAIPFPAAGRVTNPTKDWNAGFLTDQRGFDSDINASARMHSFVTLKIINKTATVIDQGHTSSGTYEVDTTTGMQLDYDKADMTGCKWSGFELTDSKTVKQRDSSSTFLKIASFPSAPPPIKTTEQIVGPAWKIDLKANASDPLVVGAADIHYNGRLTVELAPDNINDVTVNFAGRLDAFPAYEAYVKVGQETKTLFQSPPPPGNTVMNLLGYANRSITGSAEFKLMSIPRK